MSKTCSILLEIFWQLNDFVIALFVNQSCILIFAQITAIVADIKTHNGPTKRPMVFDGANCKLLKSGADSH